MVNKPMRESFESPEVISKDHMNKIIQDIIDGRFEVFDTESMADFDADFSGEEPLFINIWSVKRGYGFGYLVFHEFLRKVGLQKSFLSTDFTPDGERCFEKAVKDGLIEKTSEPFGLHRLTRWKVIGDPVQHLHTLKT